jgi:glycosyltransferase involved in cell wall biosynthesis
MAKIVISAYACEPKKGSEPGVGWNFVEQVSRFHEVWAITRLNNQGPIEEALRINSLPNVKWIYFDLPRWMRFWKRGPRGVQLYYYMWQIGIYFLARRLHREFNFDLSHHVTFVKYWTPSFIALLPIPLIWGPVGGAETTPKALKETFSLRGKTYELTRELARWFGERDPFVRLTARRSRVALATTPETAGRLKQLGSRRVQVIPQVALREDERTRLSTLPVYNSKPFRFVSVGNLIHWKGFHFGLMAFAKMQKYFPETEYWVIGDGPERRNLERLVYKLGISEKIIFFGRIDRRHVFEKLACCNVLVHPSLHDSGGFVCLEAMATGLSIICLNIGGPAMQVTEDTGFRISVSTPEQLVNDLADAMMKLASDQDLSIQMGRLARRRVEENYSWEKKGDIINQIYQEVINE